MQPRLRSLELHGYKTFASRTVFEFPGMITAIVGPNGSGKSNIADSLRWVLGEQSYSLLRGKKTEDMIFSGSEQRPRAGMASATVVFDNGDGWLPIDFGEVAITRRAYRDGQNEYLINGQRVRLKDVSELLAQSGLAERTYTIIGQGLVDAALSLNPDERRRLFEEAAGIGLYRYRRDEADRRLDATRRNLERVQDILTELQPRLRSLERQARRAQEYEQIRQTLRQHLRVWYGYHWHKAQQEVSEALLVAREKEKAVILARKELADHQQNLARIRQRIQDLRTQLNEWHRLQAQLHSQREALSRACAVTDERIRSSQELLQALQIERDRYDEDLLYQKGRVRDAEQEFQRLKEEEAETAKQAEEAREALQKQLELRAALEKEVQDTRSSLLTLEASQGQWLERLMELRSQSEEQSGSLQRADQMLMKAKGRKEKALRSLQAAKSEKKAAEADLKSAEKKFSEHRIQLGELTARRQKLQDELSEHQAEQTRIQAQLEVIQRAVGTATDYARAAQFLIDQAHQARLPGVLGILGEQLYVPEEIELAIAAALGEYLDAIVLEEKGSFEHAIELLASGGPRGVLVPLARLASVARAEIDGRKTLRERSEILGLAADLVGAPDDLRQAVDLLLGQVIVVQDRKTAQSILGDYGPGIRLVTLQGEVFHVSGPVIIGGTQAELPDQFMLRRQRKSRELQASLKEIQEHGVNLGRQIQQLDEELERVHRAVQEVENQCAAAQHRAQSAGMQVGRLEMEAEQAKIRLVWQEDHFASIQSGIKRNSIQIKEAESQLEKVRQDLLKTRALLDEQEARLNSSQVEELRDQYTHWETIARVVEKTLADGQARLMERQELLERAEATLRVSQGKVLDLEEEIRSLEVKQVAQRQAENETTAQIGTLRERIEPSEKDLETIQADYEALQIQEASARQALSLADHHHTQARLTCTRRQEALENLRRRIEEDFGLVSFEYAEDISGPNPLPLEGMVEELPRVTELPPDLEESLKHQKALLRRMGPINLEARDEYEEVRERFDYLTSQLADLEKAESDIRRVIGELDTLMEVEFGKTFAAVAGEFKETFNRLFGGGMARLVLTDPDDLTGTGIDIEARLPGRRTQGLSLLSGGERSLTASALVFALLKVSPTPFCILDEVDAMLDETNVGRFRDLLHELSQNTQFIVVTHNRNTVQVADVIYGVTMGRDSASRVISLKLDEITKVI